MIEMDAILENTERYRTIARLAAVGGIATLLGGSTIVAYFDPTQAHFFPVCPLYSLTGFACPGCGLTRGFHALFRGDLASAIHFNALIPIWVVIFSAVLISLVLYSIRGRGLPIGRISPNWLFVLLGVMIVFGVVRNIPAYPFTLLFP
ncbi:MAG: DUF2752 domain-containing protein [Acidobacteriota bacterium]